MAVTITSRTGENVSGEIPVHRHCQKTVLSASGIPSGNGATWYNISDLSEKLNYLPEKWLEKYFLFNQNITEDLASVLELINGVYGKISEISPIKHVSFYDVDNNIIGTYVPDKNGQISPKLGRKIRLMIEGQELSFATLVGSSYNVGQEINSITLPKHKLKFIKNDSTVGEADVVMDSDVNVRLPSDLISGIRLNGQINYPNSESIVDLGNVVSSIKVNGDIKTPDSNGLVDVGQFSVTNTDNNGTTISRINYNGNQYDIKMPPIGDSGSGSGSVIDGTVLHEETITNNIIVSTGTKYNLYTVKNDCLLYIKNISGLIHHYYILGNEIQYKSANDVVSLLVPVKANTVIQIDESINASTYPFTFIEYKLNSLNPQLAFPDWDESKSKTINNGDTITENGWIIIERGDSSWGKCSINGITVFDTLGVTTNANNGCATVPVSRGDVITFSGGNTAPTVTFYPAKMHEICTACQCYWQ